MQTLLNIGHTYLLVELNYEPARYIRLQYFPFDDYCKCDLKKRYYRFETLKGETWTVAEENLLRNVRTKQGYPLLIQR